MSKNKIKNNFKGLLNSETIKVSTKIIEIITEGKLEVVEDNLDMSCNYRITNVPDWQSFQHIWEVCTIIMRNDKLVLVTFNNDTISDIVYNSSKIFNRLYRIRDLTPLGYCDITSAHAKYNKYVKTTGKSSIELGNLFNPDKHNCKNN